MVQTGEKAGAPLSRNQGVTFPLAECEAMAAAVRQRSLPRLRLCGNGGKMAQQYIPERLELVNELPRTPSGKIQKFKLRETAKAFSAQLAGCSDVTVVRVVVTFWFGGASRLVFHGVEGIRAGSSRLLHRIGLPDGKIV